MGNANEMGKAARFEQIFRTSMRKHSSCYVPVKHHIEKARGGIVLCPAGKQVLVGAIGLLHAAGRALIACCAIRML